MALVGDNAEILHNLTVVKSKNSIQKCVCLKYLEWDICKADAHFWQIFGGDKLNQRLDLGTFWPTVSAQKIPLRQMTRINLQTFGEKK